MEEDAQVCYLLHAHAWIFIYPNRSKQKFSIKLAGIGLPLTCSRLQEVLAEISSEKKLNKFDSFAQHQAHTVVSLPPVISVFNLVTIGLVYL